MRFVDWCVTCVCAILTAGLLPAVLAQVELAAPGVVLFKDEAMRLFQTAIAAHGGILIMGLPLAVAGLGFAVAAEASNSRTWKWASILAIAASLGSAVGLPIAMLVGPPSIGSAVADSLAFLTGPVALVAAVVATATLKSGRLASM